ncbi:hypothetical protein SSX86_005129 [Deinandra increscens subsp. villosa]|uniref:Uncharacterized protein n=1 Tax=Deinandra increscens subsp. villosa TaxID=3103831 RepID=A0AAP0DKJ4_9ASTR
MGKLSFLELLIAPLKIISQYGKLMAITATLYLILYSIAFILGILSIKPSLLDLTLNLMNLDSVSPFTPEFNKLLAAIAEDTGIFLGIKAAYAVLFFFVALFAQTAIIIIASYYYSGHDLSPKELLLKVSKTWTRPFFTSMWVQLLALGYTSFFLFAFMVPSLVLFKHPFILIIVLFFLAILFVTLYIYLSVVWSLGVVVSVVEDSYGFSALGKARELVNGNRVYGFLLNLFCILVLLVLNLIIGSILSPSMPIVVGVIQTLLIAVIGMFQYLAYTGFYYQCKNNGMTKSVGLEYSPIPDAPVVHEDLP